MCNSRRTIVRGEFLPQTPCRGNASPKPPARAIGQPARAIWKPWRAVGEPARAIWKPWRAIGQPAHAILEPWFVVVERNNTVILWQLPLSNVTIASLGTNSTELLFRTRREKCNKRGVDEIGLDLPMLPMIRRGITV